MSLPGEWENRNALLVQSVPHGVPKWIRDATADNSAKIFTVPSGKMWDLKMVLAVLKATATVSPRALSMAIFNPSNQIVFTGIQSGTIAASQVGVGCWGVNMGASTMSTRKPELTGGVAIHVEVNDGIPPILLPPGYYIKVWDTTGGAPAIEDDLTVSIHVIEFDAKHMSV